MAELGAMLRPIRQCLHLRIPAANGAAQARVRALGQIDEEHYEGEWVHLHARIPPMHRRNLRRFGRKRNRLARPL